MARFFVRASDQYLAVAQAPVTAYPFTFACWFKTSNDDADQIVLGLSDGGASDFWNLYADTAGVNNLRFSTRAGGGASKNASVAGLTIDTWHHACGVATNSTDRDIYLDGGTPGNNADDLTPAGISDTDIGRLAGLATYYFDGSVAEVAIWKNVALTGAGVDVLAKGYSPLFVRPQNLVAYWPLIRDEDQDKVGGYDLTAYNAPSIAAHPPMIYPAPPIFALGAAAVAARIPRHGFVNYQVPGIV